MNEAKSVELDKYVGKWYEIASFPAWFARGCENATAEYTNKGDYVEVKNSCDVNDGQKTKVGKAFTTDNDNILKVQFFAPFKADYIIEFLEENYRYVVVGSQNKSYLWILSRIPNIPQRDFDTLVKIAKQKGYNVQRLMITAKKRVVEL